MTRSICLVSRAERALLVGLVCCLVTLGAGCGTLDQGPDAPAGETIEQSGLAAGQDNLVPGSRASNDKGFFPLDIGNHWDYTGELSVVIDGGAASVFETRQVRSLIGTEERFGRDYVIERRFNIDEDGDTLSPYWFRYRQDRAGLYEADIAGNEPPLDGSSKAAYVGRARGGGSERMAGVWNRISRTVRSEHREAYSKAWEEVCLKLRAIEPAAGTGVRFAALSKGPPGGVMPQEITMLKYPLHPSREWTIRDDPFYVMAAVESHEVLDLSPGMMTGYKVRIANDLFGPEDWACVWYGRAGFLGSRIHVVSEILDPNGNPMGTMVVEDSLFLESLDLIRKGRL